jgi:hypothetical protein
VTDPHDPTAPSDQESGRYLRAFNLVPWLFLVVGFLGGYYVGTFRYAEEAVTYRARAESLATERASLIQRLQQGEAQRPARKR